MNIHEYQAKAVLREFGVPVPRGIAGLRGRRGRDAAKTLGGPVWVVKAQIHAGGRGKGKFKEASAGVKVGVRIAKSVDDVNASRQADARLDAGHASDRAARQGSQPALYRGRLRHRQRVLSVDRWSTARPREVAFVVSTEGGMDIEEVAHNTPGEDLTFSIDPATGFMPHHGRTGRQGAGPDRRSRQAGREAAARSSMRPSSPRT